MTVFSSDFAEARQKFHAAAEIADAHTECFSLNIDHDAPCDLTLDVAYLGNREAQKLFIIFSGTHGLEGRAGSAAQTALLQKGIDLPDTMGVLLIHAVNPFGFANHSRANEDFVDLNRNFATFERAGAPLTEIEAQVQDIVTPAEFSLAKLPELGGQLLGLYQSYDPAAVMNAATGGQYTKSDGLNYGGHEASWSNKTVQSVIDRYCSKAEKIVLLDWHTGLGEFGAPYFISFNTPGSNAYNLSERWWGEGIFGDQSAFENSGSQPDYKGVLVAGVANKLAQQADIVRSVVEFGTYDNATMLGALVADRWLRFQAGKPLNAEALAIQQWMISRFIPDDENWRNSVLQVAETVHEQALRGLAEW